LVYSFLLKIKNLYKRDYELYKKILTIKAALDDDALDILREAESLSVKQGAES
jgi:hypothetical protein